MDPYSILDLSGSPQGAEHSPCGQDPDDHGPAERGPAELGTESEMTQMGANRSPQGSVSAVMAEANGSSAAPAPSVPHFSREDRHSLAEMAQRDLDAALQLLAERAQYITGASGAAIALRRGAFNDMQCRASSGSNVPELGALLSAEFGLSGESVRTRLALRCDDVERDTRVNREGCRQLGIVSVAVMPIVSDDEVLGVFELFSGDVNAFEERDLAALQRMGDMVETAVRLARTAQGLPTEVVGEFVDEVSDVASVELEGAAAASARSEEAPAMIAEAAVPSSALLPSAPPPSAPLPEPVVVAPLKKPLLWSAASAPATTPVESDDSHVPPILRNLRKCQACGFPVSEGRTLCVECEEKQWRGQLRVAMATAPQASAAPATAISMPRVAPEVLVSTPAAKAAAELASAGPVQLAPPVVEIPERSPVSSNSGDEPVSSYGREVGLSSGGTLPFLSTGVSSSESWFSANKYVLGAIVVVVVILAVVAVLR
jgi:hypothetical protein